MYDAEAVRAFKEFDYDGDGYVTAAEFKLAMTARHQQATGDEIDSIFAHADKDSDGKIDEAEFVQAWNA